jgi:hypothetical protein
VCSAIIRQVAAVSDQSQSHAARVALLAAILGAVVGFSGSVVTAYLPYRAQADEQVQERREVVFADFSAAAQQLRYELLHVRDIVVLRDRASYGQAREDVFEQYSDYYGSYVRAYVLAEATDPVDNVEESFRSCLLALAYDLDEVSLEALLESISNAEDAMGELVKAGRVEIQGDD